MSTDPTIQFDDQTVGDLARAYNDICNAYYEDEGIHGMTIQDFEGMIVYLATLNAYAEAASEVNPKDPDSVRLDDLARSVQHVWSTREYMTEGTDEPLINASEMLNRDE